MTMSALVPDGTIPFSMPTPSSSLASISAGAGARVGRDLADVACNAVRT